MLEFLSSNATMLGGVGGGGIVLYILKKIPNESICKVVESTFKTIGKVMTLGLSKWKFTKSVWNKTVEPWFIDLIDNVIGSVVRGFIKGLRSDNG